ncbi:hypothetical protein [Streptomyces boncukensis]|uniref:Uncharacterized protein n=1 Tax=Streptomyces boncukensis TaxID=2711219 RepID=A0A6G4X977_9ACTN|nr:hypothetical protein [Streptomyces boncukensis]NGO73304.1 hypothetical protein [Streptomyces boncukensis]
MAWRRAGETARAVDLSRRTHRRGAATASAYARRALGELERRLARAAG